MSLYVLDSDRLRRMFIRYRKVNGKSLRTIAADTQITHTSLNNFERGVLALDADSTLTLIHYLDNSASVSDYIVLNRRKVTT